MTMRASTSRPLVVVSFRALAQRSRQTSNSQWDSVESVRPSRFRHCYHAMMNWEAIGAIGEIFGALAVVATLMYLARQMRQDARATTGETMGSWLADYNNMLLEISRDPELAKIFRQGLTDFEQLNENDQMRFHTWMVAHLLNAQTVFLQLEDGIMHQRIADQILPVNAAMLDSKGGTYWWGTARSIWRPEFVDHMDKLIEEASPITEVWPWFSTDSENNRAGDA